MGHTAKEATSELLLEDMAFEEIVRAKLRSFLRRFDGYPLGESLYDDVVDRVERPLIELVLEHTGGNQLRAAQILGLNRNTLRKKLEKLGLAGGNGKTHAYRRARRPRR